jgi:hypothetical protein
MSAWDTLADAARLLAPLFGGTEEQKKEREKQIRADVCAQVDRRKRVLNGPPDAIDVEGVVVEEPAVRK